MSRIVKMPLLDRVLKNTAHHKCLAGFTVFHGFPICKIEYERVVSFPKLRRVMCQQFKICKCSEIY